MAQQLIIDYGTAPNSGDGDPLRDAFIKVDENFSNIWNAGPVGSNITINNNTIAVVDTNGYLILRPNGIGVIQTRNNVVPWTSDINDLGSQNLRYRGLYVGSSGANVTGNVSASYFIGNGSLLTGVSTSANAITSGNTQVNIPQPSGNVVFTVSGESNVAVFSDQLTTLSRPLVVNGGAAVASAALVINSTDSMLVPVGNTLQRPATAQVGMMRFNTGPDVIEVYTAQGWEPVGSTDFTVIVNDQFVGDNSTTVFTLSQGSTTDGVIVTVNGIQQIPTDSYTVTGDEITFTEAPVAGDAIDVRILTTSTSVDSISNTSGNASITVTDANNQVTVTGLLSASVGFRGPLVTKTSTAAGQAGDITWDQNYIYVCTATNTWRRAQLNTY